MHGWPSPAGWRWGMGTREEQQEVGRAGEGSPPQLPKASQKRNQLSGFTLQPHVPTDQSQSCRGGLGHLQG